MLLQCSSHLAPMLLQVRFAIFWKERGKGGFLDERMWVVLLRESGDVPLVNIVRVPCCRCGRKQVFG